MKIKLPSIFGLMLLIASMNAHAQLLTGDTFQFGIYGYNATSGVGYYLTPDDTATVGATTTFSGVGVDLTISSNESTSGSTITDTFTVSTPMNFITSASINGTTINGLEFDLGTGRFGGNTVDFLNPISQDTASGYIIYSTNTKFALVPSTTLTNDNQSLAAFEAVYVGSGSISQLDVHSFTYSISYTPEIVATPEPSTWILLIAGIGGLIAFRRIANSRRV
jgi:hypothetical protein